MSKTIKIDDDAHSKLFAVKQYMKDRGIDSPSFSDAFRWTMAIAGMSASVDSDSGKYTLNIQGELT